MRALFLAALFLLVLAPARALAADAIEVVHGEFGKKLDEAVREFPGIDFSGSVLCARDGVVYLAKGYGLADRGKRRPCTTLTLFDIGSVAKQHTAAAVLLLQDRGLLSVADTIDEHFDAVPEDKAKITIHQILTHTSGLARGMDAGKIRPELHTDREAFVRTVLGIPLESAPGTAFAYNNMAYMLLAALVERASGEEFGPFLKRHLFHPLMMTSTGYCGDRSLDASLASLRYADDSGAPAGSAIEYSFSWLNRGATSIVTNVWDMYRWSEAVLDDGVISKAARETWVKPEKDDYACGWMRRPGVGGRPKISHGGDTRGFHTMYSIYPEENAVVVLLANVKIPREKYDLTKKLEAILLERGAGGAEGSESAMDGRYRLSGDNLLKARRRGGITEVGARGQPALDRLLLGAAFEKGGAGSFEKRNRKVEEVFKPLIRRRRKDFLKAFPGAVPTRAAEAVLERWEECEDELGRAKGIEVLGSCDPGTGIISWAECRHAKGVSVWRVTWKGDEPAMVAYAGRRSPFRAYLTGAENDRLSGRSLLGNRPLVISFDMARRKVKALVLEKVDGFPAKRAVCNRMK